MAAYIKFGVDPGHLLAASVMSAPAALVCAKMFYPETEKSETAGEVTVKLEKSSVNVFDAVCTGAADGMKLVLNVAAMLLAFVCIIYGMDWCISELHRLIDPGVETPLTFSIMIDACFRLPTRPSIRIPTSCSHQVDSSMNSRTLPRCFASPFLAIQSAPEHLTPMSAE